MLEFRAGSSRHMSCQVLAQLTSEFAHTAVREIERDVGRGVEVEQMAKVEARHGKTRPDRQRHGSRDKG